jgi:hypothetical protein
MNPQAQIEAIKSQGPRVLERDLRDAGYSKTMAREVVHNVLGETPEDDRCDADAELVEMISAFNEKLTADAMARMRIKLQ